MQNSYVHSAGQWHLVNNAYAHTAGQWHLVNNAYVHYNGSWHLAKSAGSNLDEIYDNPGAYTYVVPDGVYNVQVQYPTPSGKQSLNLYKVIPGQEIKVNVGIYASTSSIVVNTSTYVLPAFDTLVATINTEIPSQLDVEFSAATPTGAAVSISSTNAGAKDIAAASGAIYNVLYYSTYQDQTYNATINLTPVKSELINWPNARIVRTAWSGRNRVSTTIPLDLKTGNFYTAGFTQNDDGPGSGSAPYSFVFNVQQILKIVITPIAPDLAVSSMSIPTVLNNAIAGVVFNTQFNVIGGQAPFTWTSTPSTYGSGVTLITSGGLFSYTTSSAGTYSFSVRVTDSTGAYVSKSYNLSITGVSAQPSTTPVISSITPTSGSVDGGTSITINGSNFTGATGATFGGAAGTGFNVLSDTVISVTTPAGSAGTADVRVYNDITYGDGGNIFTYVATGPTLTIFPGFTVSPGNYPIPFTPIITLSSGSGNLTWQLSNGTYTYSGSQSITAGTSVTLSINAHTGTNYTLTANVGSIVATPATGMPIGS